MIKIVRDTKLFAAVFKSPELLRQRARAQKFFATASRKRSQQWFNWDSVVEVLGRAEPEILRSFNGKCAYCESDLREDSAYEGTRLNYFRPTSGAMDHDGSVAADHYWWLAFEPTNLLASCGRCAFSKGKRFPIKKKKRGALGAKGAALRREEPLLLDPGWDTPEDHLLFSDDGNVASRSERGRITIQVLSLNRAELVDKRLACIRELRAAFDDYIKGLTSGRGESAQEALKAFLHPARPYSAAVNDCVRLWLDDVPSTIAQLIISGAVQGAGAAAPRGASRAEFAAAQQQLVHELQQNEAQSVEETSDSANSAYFSGARRIERIELKNFRGLRELDVRMPQRSAQGSWLMLIGENGTGKSSLLQALAITLAGQRHVNRLGLDARDFLNHDTGNKDDAGFVKVHLTNISRPVELSFSKYSPRFTTHPQAELVLLFAYGATRVLPRSVTTKDKPTRYLRIKNLFNPYARLQDAQHWLTDREKVPDARFRSYVRAIKRLLLLEPDAEIRRERRRIVVDSGRRSSGLEELSDGYQSVVALAVDIMIGLARWEDIEEAEGVVLIDELDAHLHPRWKMEIVTRLRHVFPKLTFIATTHDPLCLRGLHPGEIGVVRRTASGVDMQIVQEPIGHLNAAQLLTSPLFGLVGTRDRPTDEVLREERRYDALFLKGSRSPKEEAELQSLRARIVHRSAVGGTPTAVFVEDAVRKALHLLEPSLSETASVVAPPARADAIAALREKFTELVSAK